MAKTFTSKILAWLLTLVLVTGFLPVLQPQKAYAAQMISRVELKVDLNAIPMNGATTGKQANDAFRTNRGLEAYSQNMCKLDGMYSFIAEVSEVSSSTGCFLRKRLADSEELLQPGKNYYMVFNVIQKEGYEFPATGSTGKDGNLQMTVVVNGKTWSVSPNISPNYAHVDRYNNDSIDIYVPIAFDSSPILDSVSLSPNGGYAQAGKTTDISIKEIGRTTAGYDVTLKGNTKSGTRLDVVGGKGESELKRKLVVDAAEPAGTKLTITARSKDFPTMSTTADFVVISGEPVITSMKVTPGNTNVDVSTGDSKTVHFDVSMQGTSNNHSYDIQLINAHEAGTKISNQTDNGFDLTVSAYEPTGAIRLLLSSKATPSVQNFVTVGVTGIPRVNYVDLMVDTTKIYRKMGTQTCQDIMQYVNYDHIKSVSAKVGNDANTYVDFGGTYDRPYTCVVKRIEGKTGWGYNDFERVDRDATLQTGTQYYLRINVENREKGTNKSLWPKNLSSIAFSVNGKQVGQQFGYGFVDWYSETTTGSVAVFVPLPNSQGDIHYSMKEIAPGINAVVYENGGVSEKVQQMTVMTYKGKTMNYVYTNPKTMYEGTWYSVVYGDTTSPRNIDFVPSTISKQEFYLYGVTNLRTPLSYQMDVIGDVNGSDRLNIVDAQVCYDVAKGGVYTKESQIDGEHILMCDVNGDSYIDASDAFAIQYAVITGYYGKG